MDEQQKIQIASDYLMLKRVLTLAMDYSVNIESSTFIDEIQILLENFLAKLSPMQDKELNQIVEEYIENKVKDHIEAIEKS